MGSFRRWLTTLVDDRKNASSPKMWAGTVVLVLGILLLTSFVEPVAGWFRLDFWRAIVCFLPSVTLGFVGGHLEHRGRLGLRTYGVLVLINNALLQFFFASLVSLSEAPGSFALASLLVLTLAFHGYMTRTSAEFPFTLPGSIAALLGAALLDPSRETWSLFAFVGPTGLMVALLTGQAGLREHRDRREREQLRQAIHYRALSENAQAHSETSERLVDLLRYNHDAGNTLSTVFLNAQLLEEQVKNLPSATGDASSLHPAVARLLEQLGRLKSLINRAHQLAEAPIVERVSLREILDSTVEECRGLHPGIRFEISAPDDLVIRVQDGEMGLRRILENLLVNACEGNGSHQAFHVRVHARVDGSNAVLAVADDGPGFSSEQLAKPLVPFLTTKAQGSGLGLFNVSHLVQASGGTLRRENGASGALVEVELPLVVTAERDEPAPSSEAAISGERVRDSFGREFDEEPARAGGDSG